ncbi:MAG TPA: hypothetical protein VF691_16300 [Cytophagaceae bacterium]|jgi:hypothetical protein
MATIKIRPRHIRYFVLTVLLGTAQFYRNLSDEAIPVVADDYSSTNYVISKTTGLISRNEDEEREEEILEGQGADELIGSNNPSPSGSFSQGTFAYTISPSTPRNASGSDAARGSGQATSIGGSQSSEMIYFAPAEDQRKPALAANFTRQYSVTGKFASVGLPGGGEVLDVPPPPPTPDETPLDSTSFTILLIGLVMGSFTILRSKSANVPLEANHPES